MPRKAVLTDEHKAAHDRVPPPTGCATARLALGREEERILTSHLRQTRHPAGNVLFREGSRAGSVFFLEGGTVQVSRRGAAGRTLVLGLYRPGDVLGDAAFLGGETVPVTATCLEPCVTRELAAAMLARLVQERPALGIAIIRSLAAQVRWLTGRIGALSEPTLEERTHAVLVNVARKLGRPHPRGRLIEVPLSHGEIARLVGSHRVSVTRALSRLKDAGRVQLDGRAMLILGTN